MQCLWVNRGRSKEGWGRGSLSLWGPASHSLPPIPVPQRAGNSAGCQVVTHLHSSMCSPLSTKEAGLCRIREPRSPWRLSPSNSSARGGEITQSRLEVSCIQKGASQAPTLLPLNTMDTLRWPPGRLLWSPSTTCGRPALSLPAPSESRGRSENSLVD